MWSVTLCNPVSSYKTPVVFLKRIKGCVAVVSAELTTDSDLTNAA